MNFIQDIIKLLEQYDKEKKEQGFIPTVEMLVEDLKEKYHGKV